MLKLTISPPSLQGLQIVSVGFGGEAAKGICVRISSLWRRSESVIFPVFNVLSELSARERWLVPVQHFCGVFSFQQRMAHLSLGIRRSCSWF